MFTWYLFNLPRLSQKSVPTSFSDVVNLSHRGVSAEPLQRADQLSGRCWWCQLRRRLSVSSGRAEDRPAHPGRTAHAQWPRHGACRPRHRGHVQDGQAVTQEADCGKEQEEEKKHTNLWMERNKGQDEPSPSLHGRPAVRPALDSVKPFETMCHQKTTGKKTSSGLQGNGLAVVLIEIGRSALSLACCVYGVPLHATYIPKMHIDNFFFFSYPL